MEHIGFKTKVIDRYGNMVCVGDTILYSNHMEWGIGTVFWDALRLQIYIKWSEAQDKEEIDKETAFFYFSCSSELEIIKSHKEN